MSDNKEQDETTERSRQSLPRTRPRAPTITIDTTVPSLLSYTLTNSEFDSRFRASGTDHTATNRWPSNSSSTILVINIDHSWCSRIRRRTVIIATNSTHEPAQRAIWKSVECA